MKTQAQQLSHLETASVWGGEMAPKASKQGTPGVRPLVVTAAVVLALTLVLSVQVYLGGLKAFREQAARSGGDGVAVEALNTGRSYALHLALASVGGSTGLFVVMLLCGHLLRLRWTNHHAAVTNELEFSASQLVGRLAESRIQEEEAQKQKVDAETRLQNITATYLALQRDLDARKQAEKNLAQQAQQLERSKDVLELHVQARTQEMLKMQKRNELILNSAGDGICGFDLQGRATFVNPTAAKITGWKVEELIGKTEDIIFFPARGKNTKGGPAVAKDEKGNCLPEQTFHRRDGTTFPAEYLRTPIKEGDRVVGAVVIFKDITERKLAEDKLSHKAAELARSNAELEQFAFVASHDLQEPLRKIQAFGDRLKLKCESAHLDEGKDYLERMQSAAARMQTLINDLLTFSRIIRSAQPFMPVNLAAVTKEVLGDLEVRIEKSSAQIDVATLPTIEADPTQMRQLLQNLIGNALKFQIPGSIPKIKIDAQLVTRDQIKEDAGFPKPPPTAKPDDKFCVITVQDNGIGFEEQYLEKVFAVFQRLHGRGEYEGTGVGLAVCRRITDRHGGLITAQSKPGEGSIFIVILPLQQPKEQPAK
jgi:PAS domain S-box-containing protein